MASTLLEDRIDEKCNLAGCHDDKRRAKHRDLYVNEHWDVHPPADFIAWMKRVVPCKNPDTGARIMDRATYENHVTAWNSKPVREEFEILKRVAALGLSDDWLDTPNRDLSDRTPRDACDTQQTELVTALLSELETGSFAS